MITGRGFIYVMKQITYVDNKGEENVKANRRWKEEAMLLVCDKHFLRERKEATPGNI
jgi:hypothetical protein